MKRSTPLAAVLGILGIANCTLRADLIAHWPLDASAADVVSGLDGVEAGGVDYGAAGANENTGEAAIFFDGVIDVPFAEDLNPPDFTVTAWARSTGGGGHRAVITSRYDGIVFGGGNLDGFIIYSDPSNQWQFWTGDGESAVDIWDVLPGSTTLLDEWQHIAITFDSETQTKTLYIDGFLEASTVDQGYQPVTSLERALHIGGGGDLGDQFRWVGEIDDVGLWDEVLTEDQILEVMEDGVASFGGPVVEDTPFRRGDTNADGAVNLTDAVFVLNFLFLGGAAPSCQEAADTNGDAALNLTDAVFILNFLFLGGGAPPPPNECAPRPGADCANFSACVV